MLNKYKTRKNKKAFTLIELIVTIAVLGVLVLLAAPRLLSYTEQAELTRIQHDTKVMENKMSEVLNQDNNYNEWDDNEKDLGALILRNQLFEKEGLATRVDKSHLARGTNLAQSDSDSELGVGGSLIDLGDGETTGYKIIPEEFKTTIGTHLEGTFYSNENGKVYYEPNKPLTSIKQEQELACVSAEDLDYEFSVIDGKGTITGYNGTLTHLYIPSAFLIDDECVPVQVIGAGAFSNLGTLVKVYIPQSVERIEERAFEGNKLTQVEIPHSVDYIGENAFYNNNLSSETIVIKNESSNMEIVHGAFSGQPSGEVSPVYSPVTDKDLGIVFDRSTGTIVASTGGPANRNGSNYESYVRIPSTIVVENVVHEVKEIAQGAYQGQGIIFVEFPDTLERIEDYAFAGNQLINVTIPSNVGHVGNYAFAFNEVYDGKNSTPTIGDIKISNNNYQYSSDVNDLGNLAPGGNEIKNISNTLLLDHVLLASSNNFEIPEEYNPIDNKDNDDSKREPLENEIVIRSAEELSKIGIDKNYPLDGDYIQMANIDLKTYRNWKPIGIDRDNQFSGKFDGNGYKIYNLTINKDTTEFTTDVGLFGFVNGALIENVSLVNLDINVENSRGETYLYVYVGGLAGEISNSTIINSKVEGKIINNSNDWTGGIVGVLKDSSIYKSSSNISIDGYIYSGGIAGRSDNSKISETYAIGDVKAGFPESQHISRVGGLVGEFIKESKLENSYFNGKVIGSGKASTQTATNAQIGGLIGLSNNEKNMIENSYFVGELLTETYRGVSSVSGIVGRNTHLFNVTNSYWNLGIESNANGGGKGKSVHDMKFESTYNNWNFDEIWDIDEGNTFPTLINNK